MVSLIRRPAPTPSPDAAPQQSGLAELGRLTVDHVHVNPVPAAAGANCTATAARLGRTGGVSP